MTEINTDWPKQCYFRVIDYRKIKRWDEKHDYHVHVLSEQNELKYSTWHVGEASMLMEVEIWLNRGARPEGIDAFNATEKIKHQIELRNKNDHI